MEYDLVIVGGGNMGAALVGGLLARRAPTQPDALAVVEISEKRRHELSSQFPDLAVMADPPPCRAGIIAVKPAGVGDAARMLAAAGARRLLSIAAGVPTGVIEEAAGPEVAVIRAMPNTPALVGRGATAIAAGAAAGSEHLDWAADLLESVGIVVRVEESEMDAVTALSGSGPAYVFLVAEALIEAGVSCGLDRVLAATLTTQLLVGSAALLEATGEPAALRAQVTSPGGTTAAGLAVLDGRGVRAAFVAAVDAAAARSRELGRPGHH